MQRDVYRNVHDTTWAEQVLNQKYLYAFLTFVTKTFIWSHNQRMEIWEKVADQAKLLCKEFVTKHNIFCFVLFCFFTWLAQGKMIDRNNQVVNNREEIYKYV